MAAKTRLIYHLILTTRYRKPALEGIEEQVYEAMRKAEKESSLKILEMGIEHGNHIHLVIKAKPRYSISGYVTRIKGITQKHLWDNCGEHLQRHYWGKTRKLWQGVYYCYTVGNSNLERLLTYVTEQEGPRPLPHSSAELKTPPVSGAKDTYGF